MKARADDGIAVRAESLSSSGTRPARQHHSRVANGSGSHMSTTCNIFVHIYPFEYALAGPLRGPKKRGIVLVTRGCYANTQTAWTWSASR